MRSSMSGWVMNRRLIPLPTPPEIPKAAILPGSGCGCDEFSRFSAAAMSLLPASSARRGDVAFESVHFEGPVLGGLLPFNFHY